MPLDRFSAQAALYALYRISYPPALYAWLLPQVAGRQRARDCATGNGQVAAALAPYFAQVAATDLSANQLAQAPALPNVRYQVASAERAPFAAHAFDLITVGQAAHWFELAAWHQEVRRVARPGATLAEWGYGLVHTGEPALDALIQHFHDDTLGPYWDENRWHVIDEYAQLPFAFANVQTARFAVARRWSAAWFLAYLRTWSAVVKYGQQHGGADVVATVAEALEQRWGAGEREVVFPAICAGGASKLNTRLPGVALE